MKAILSAALALGLCGLAGAQDKADPVGTWKCEYEIGGQKRTSSLTVKKDGDKLAGTMAWPHQKEARLKDVRLKTGRSSAERALIGRAAKSQGDEVSTWARCPARAGRTVVSDVQAEQVG
jgi:hypothetical protein